MTKKNKPSRVATLASGKPKKSLPSFAEVQEKLKGDPNLTLLNEDELAVLLGCSASKLQKSRVDGGGVPFIRDGRAVRYRLKDVASFLERRKRFVNTAGGLARASNK